MARARRTGRAIDPWPGWVDALSTLLMVFIFLLVAFSLAQTVLTHLLSGRDDALAQLQSQVDELADLLSLERQANADLRLNAAQLSAELQRSVAARDDAAARLAAILAERDELQGDLAASEEARAALDQEVSAGEDALRLRLAEIESLRRDIAALERARTELEAKVGALAAAVETSEREAGALRDRSRELEARLATAEERTLLAQNEIEQRDIRLSELLDLLALNEREITEAKDLSAQAQAQVALLNQQIAALREQLAALADALDLREREMRDKDVQIADLGRKLNLALAGRVQELERYRSEFFGRLREVLGNRPDVRIEGDRFVFQSEVLFESGSAALGDGGKVELAQLAATLLAIAREIPADLPWVLRVDGHTDNVPIHTLEFASNWELATARALSVVEFLIGQGVPPERLAAAGFGEYHPLDPRDDEIAHRRNRRIELKFDQR
ncbi:MAG: peptidoglycan -binding protein [Alphaproteobacteria bacterium]